MGLKSLKTFFKRLFLFLVLTGLIAGCVYIYFYTDLIHITQIKFNKNEHVDLYDIQRYSGVSMGTFYFEVNEKDAAEKLLSHPYIKTVKAVKKFPNTLTFDIEYREHYFNIRYSDMVLSLDNQLHVLEVLAVENEGVTVEGFAFDSFSTGSVIDVHQLYVLENIVNLIDLIKQSQLNISTLIEFKSRNIVIKIDEISVEFGVGDHIVDKFNAFANIYETLKAQGITTGVIDVSTDGLPVYRPFGE